MRPSISAGPPQTIGPAVLPVQEPSGFDDTLSPVEIRLFTAVTVEEAQTILAESDQNSEE